MCAVDRLSPATVQRFRATFLAAVNYLAREEGFDPPKLPRGDRVNNKRIRFLSSDQADRLVFTYAEHVQPIAITLRWQGLRIGEALRVDWVHVNWSGNSIFVAREQDRRSAHPDHAQAHAEPHCIACGCRVDRQRKAAYSLPSLVFPIADPRQIQNPERQSDQEGARHGLPPCRDRRFSRARLAPPLGMPMRNGRNRP